MTSSSDTLIPLPRARSIRLVWGLLCCLAFPALGQAASTLNFPRLAFEPDAFTGIAIANPTGQDAAVTLTAYGENGQRLSGGGFTNPASLTIRANQQVARLTTELFGGGLPSGTIGWLQATSPVDGLTGFFLFLDGGITYMDGADLPPAAQKLTFHQVRVSAGFSTELDLVNPATVVANVQVQLVSAGDAPVVRFFTIPARGAKRVDVGPFFGVADVAASAYIAVQADVEVAGIEFVQDPGGDLLGLNARRTSERLNRLAFPQLAVRGDYTTELGIINQSASPVILTITALKPSGALYDTGDLSNNPVTRTLAGGESLREELGEMFGFRGSRTLDGWVEVRSTATAVDGYLTYGIPATGAIAAVTTTAQARTRNLFSHIATVGYFTGVAVLNPSTLASNIRIVALRPSGQILGSYDTVLEPGQRIARLLGTSELIPEAANQNGGLIWIKSDLPVYAASVFGSKDVLANIPAQEAPEAYNPDAGLATMRITPPLAIVPPTRTQQFRVDGGTGTPQWKVDGISGGQAAVGTVSATGNFTAPNAVPPRQVVTVSAETALQSSGASVDVLDRSAVGGDFRVVQSVAYVQSLAKLYAAEFTALGFTAPRPAPAAVEAGNSQIFEIVAGGARTSVASFGSEKIAKLLPMRAADGRDYLLLAAQASGRVIRFNPVTRQLQDVVTGLKEPSALVFDPITGDLLVAESDKIANVARSVLEAGLTPASPEPSGTSARAGAPGAPIAFAGAAGLAIDRCTGKLYFTVPAEGLLVEYDPATGRFRTVVSGLRNPTSLLGLFRKGVSCPDGFHLMISEKPLDRTILVVPSGDSVANWIAAPGVNDIAFLPTGNPFTSLEGILIGENRASTGSVTVVGLTNMYGTNPFNPPDLPVVENRADVTAAIAVSPEPAQVLGPLIYTITAGNRGPATATGVRVTDKLPAQLTFVSASSTQGTCSILRGTVDCSVGSIAPNGRAVVTLRVTVNNPPAGGTIQNTASVTSAELDPDVSNNTATAATTVSSLATRLEVTGIANPASVGTATSMTLTARDSTGAVAINYTGTVRFTSTDPASTLPPNYTFTIADRGVRVFSNGVTFRTTGTQTVSAADLNALAVAGSQTVQVNAGGASGSFLLTTPSPSWSAGAGNSLTVTVRDTGGNVAPTYRGTIRFTSTDAKSILPADYTFTAADAGIHTFTGIVLRSAGAQVLTATDTVFATLTANRTITVTPGEPSVFRITGLPAAAAAGASVSCTVTAVDVWDNTATGYRGTALFTSSDTGAVLPANYTFTAADAGAHTFTGLVFKTVGEQSVTVRDSTILFLAGTARTQVTVAPSGAPPPASPR